MESMRAVIETGATSPMLSIPGPGGYSISWQPGARHFPLMKSPSGHLVIPMHNFADIPQQFAGGLHPCDEVVFHAVGRPNWEWRMRADGVGYWVNGESTSEDDSTGNSTAGHTHQTPSFTTATTVPAGSAAAASSSASASWVEPGWYDVYPSSSESSDRPSTPNSDQTSQSDPRLVSRGFHGPSGGPNFPWQRDRR